MTTDDDLSESYRTVHYELRPAKQVERRMLIDAFQILQEAGFRIRRYKYFGMGSVYFVDYILLHKYLGIDSLLSVEASQKIRKRVLFNRPFGVVGVEHGTAGEYIPTLKPSDQHIVWLDYDRLLTKSHLEDVRQAAQHLSPGSILLVTFDAELPNRHRATPKETAKYYRDQAEAYIPMEMLDKEWERDVMPELIMNVTRQVIQEGVRFRAGLQFRELLFFQYADGRRMVTLGGMICSDTESKKIDASEVGAARYSRLNWDDGPFSITVPLLTKRERHFLDMAMPCDDSWEPGDFEMSPEDVQAYRDIYRFIPAYAELFL